MQKRKERRQSLPQTILSSKRPEITWGLLVSERVNYCMGGEYTIANRFCVLTQTVLGSTGQDRSNKLVRTSLIFQNVQMRKLVEG